MRTRIRAVIAAVFAAAAIAGAVAASPGMHSNSGPAKPAAMHYHEGPDMHYHE